MRFHPRSVVHGLVAAAIMSGTIVAGCLAADEAGQPSPTPESEVDPSTVGTVVGEAVQPADGTIVTLTSRDGRPLPPPRAKRFMDQEQTTFVPDALTAVAGFPVAFYNSDHELHNVNVRSTERTAAEFNRSIPPGGTFDHVFATPGFYHVRCDIHVAMYAEIFVADTPFAQWLGPDGAFVFENVPVGSYTLALRTGSSMVLEQPVDVSSGRNEVRIGS